MLGSYIDDHPLINMITGTAGCPFPSAGDARWQQLPDSVRQSLKSLAGKYRTLPYPVLTATQFMAFVRDGSRKAYEDPYFFRRTKLAAAFIGCCVEYNPADADQVIDGLWCICEETSWVISAHNGSSHEGMRPARERPLPDTDNPYIDLFAAQTAMILSFIVSMLGKRLDSISPIICRRVRQEIEKRIIIPFMSRDDYWWMGFIRKDLCNWTPWIVSNVLLTGSLMLNDRIRLCELTERACRMLDRWLDIMPGDGGCDEGAGYWNMAGGAMLDCLELLEHITSGQMTFWNDEKLRNILSFPVNVQLENGWFVNFADCDARPYLSGERLQYAGERIHDDKLISMGMQLRRDSAYQLSDTPQLWRMLNELFHPMATYEACKVPPRDVYLPDLQVRVLQKSGSILVAHGGNNGESHNHNDVGSFMLYTDGEPQIIDAGNMVYTAKTFSDKRYELWNVRSINHNVPIIGGFEQHDGKAFRAESAARTDSGMEISFVDSYPESADVRSLNRSLSLDEGGTLRLTDKIVCGHPEKITWVFMLRGKPVINGSGVRTGMVEITVPDNVSVAFEEIAVADARMKKNFPGSLWRLTCDDTEATEHNAEFIFRRLSV